MSRHELTIRSGANFRDTFTPLLDTISSLYWLLDLVAGPFTLHEHPQGLEVAEEELFESYYLDSKALADTVSSLWRPGVLPRYADYLWEDEGGYFVGYRADDDDAGLRLGEHLFHHASWDDFGQGALLGDLYLLQLDWGHWEVTTRDEDWWRRLRDGIDPRWITSSERSTREPGA